MIKCMYLPIKFEPYGEKGDILSVQDGFRESN